MNKHIKDILKYGLLIGIPLGVAAYMFLYCQGQQLKADGHAYDVQMEYRDRLGL